MSKPLIIWKIRISISQEESSSDQNDRQIDFDWSTKSRTGIKIGKEFWPKNWTFSIDQESDSKIKDYQSHLTPKLRNKNLSKNK